MRKEAPEDRGGKDIEASLDNEAVIETEAKPTDIRHVKEIGHIDVVAGVPWTADLQAVLRPMRRYT